MPSCPISSTCQPSRKTATCMSSSKRPAAAGRNSPTTRSSKRSRSTKSLLTGLTYPHDWGFVPSTKADDGDPLDIMVIHDAATFPGLVITCRVIGILQIEQKNKSKAERNDRLFAVPRRSHSERALKDVETLQGRFRKSLRSSSSRRTSLRTRSSRSSAGRDPRWRCRPSRTARNLSRKNDD